MKKKTHETVKQELLISLKENDEVEESGLDETANATKDPTEAVVIIQREEIIKMQNKRAIVYIGKQGQLLKKFKDTKQLFEPVGQSKSTIHSNMGLCKLNKYPTLEKSTLSSNYFKNNFRVIKTMCKNNVTPFSYITLK